MQRPRVATILHISFFPFFQNLARLMRRLTPKAPLRSLCWSGRRFNITVLEGFGDDWKKFEESLPGGRQG